jgi:hypothetical protein
MDQHDRLADANVLEKKLDGLVSVSLVYVDCAHGMGSCAARRICFLLIIELCTALKFIRLFDCRQQQDGCPVKINRFASMAQDSFSLTFQRPCK